MARGGGCFARSSHDASSCYFGPKRWLHLLSQHTTGQPSSRLQGLQSSKNSALLAGDQSNWQRFVLAGFSRHLLLQGGSLRNMFGSSPLFCFSISLLKLFENQKLLHKNAMPRNMMATTCMHTRLYTKRTKTVFIHVLYTKQV